MNAHEKFIRIVYYLAKIDKNLSLGSYTAAIDCYGPLQTPVLVFFKLKENQ